MCDECTRLVEEHSDDPDWHQPIYEFLLNGMTRAGYYKSVADGLAVFGVRAQRRSCPRQDPRRLCIMPVMRSRQGVCKTPPMRKRWARCGYPLTVNIVT
jgi:hypothetical protein